ncbi:mechanosensitive ion channel family protein [Myroides sp. LJL119]
MESIFTFKVIVTIITLLIYYPCKRLISILIMKFSTQEQRKARRVKTVIRLFNLLLAVVLIIILLTIWGVNPESVMIALTSVFTVIGVAMFAQWSLLSNITAGILLFFSFPFRIGDDIKIQDKDFPVEGKIIDIKAFCTILLSTDKERISYPNSLLLQKGIVIVDKKANRLKNQESQDKGQLAAKDNKA